MNLTYREKANLAHVLFLFPVIMLAIYPEMLKNTDPEYVKALGAFLILLGSVYHIYNFLHASRYLI